MGTRIEIGDIDRDRIRWGDSIEMGQELEIGDKV